MVKGPINLQVFFCPGHINCKSILKSEISFLAGDESSEGINSDLLLKNSDVQTLKQKGKKKIHSCVAAVLLDL